MDVFVARQPILDTKKRVVAYELLFRNGLTNSFDESVDGHNATQNLVTNSLIFLGLDALTGGKKAFINFTDSNIKSGIVKLLPKELVTVEILEDVQLSRALMSACKNLHKLGYQLALDDFVFHPRYQPLIELADIIKIDFLITSQAQERQKIREIIPAHIKLLAEKVETEEDFKQGLEFGYEYFQGYFFSKPDIVMQKVLPIRTLSQILLIKEVNGVEFNVGNLEDLIKHDVALAHKLLKYINSPGIGIKNKIRSIRQAIMLLGLIEIRKWVNIVSLRELSAEKPSELFVISLIRGKLCELIATKILYYENSDMAFLVGMFSLLDAFLDRPMEELLIELKLSTELEEGILGKGGILTEILNLVQAYEKGNWLEVEHICQKNNVAIGKVAELYQQAICWSNTLMTISI